MYCNKCGEQLPEGTKFCTKCGSDVIVSNATSESTPESQQVSPTDVISDGAKWAKEKFDVIKTQIPKTVTTKNELQEGDHPLVDGLVFANKLCVPMFILRVIDVIVWIYIVITQFRYFGFDWFIAINAVITIVHIRYAFKILPYVGVERGALRDGILSNEGLSGICAIWYIVQLIFFDAGSILVFLIILDVAIVIISFICTSKIPKDNKRFRDFWDHNGRIYYCDNGDGGKIYSIRFDNTDVQKHNDEKSKNLALSGDRIYYSNADDGGKLYSMRLDGSDKRKHTKKSSRFISINADMIGYVDMSDETKILNVSFNESEVVNN